MTSHDFRPLKGLPSMGVLNCIVVEDNNKQSALLKEYIAKTPQLNFAADATPPEKYSSKCPRQGPTLSSGISGCWTTGSCSG